MKVKLPNHARLRIYRLQRGMQMKALAHDLSVSLSYYSRMEEGSRPVPDAIVEELELDQNTLWLEDMLKCVHSPIYVRRLFKCLRLGDDYVNEPS